MCHGPRLNQRSVPRATANHLVMCTTSRDVSCGRLLDVGLSGCAVESPRLLTVGECVKLSVWLPDERESLVITLAKVRWWADGYAGLEFLYLFPNEESRLRMLVGV